MAKKIKPIVSAGVYNVATPEGQRQMEAIPPDRLARIAKTGNDMIAAGIRIPAPFYHDPNAVPRYQDEIERIRVGNDGTLKSSLDNQGFWDKFWVQAVPDARTGTLIPTLFGETDIPGDEQDPRTPAWKVGNTVKETSIYLRPTFTDGHNRTWTDAPMHVAFVTHPIESGQGPPVSLPQGNAGVAAPDGSLAIAMSHSAFTMNYGPSGNGSGQSANESVPQDSQPDPPNRMNTPEQGVHISQDITSIIEALRLVAKVSLPDDTNEENLIERLQSALTQKQLSEMEDEVQSGITRQPPQGSVQQPAQIIMAFTPSQIDALLRSNATNPDTGRPFTRQELESAGRVQMSQPAAAVQADVTTHPAYQNLQQATNVLMAQTTNQARANRLTRIQALVGQRKISQAYADTHLIPLLNDFQMSFTTDAAGNPVERPQAIDAALSAVENYPALQSPAPAPRFNGNVVETLNAILMGQSGLDFSGGNGFTAEANPWNTEMDEAQANDIADSICAAAGYGQVTSR